MKFINPRYTTSTIMLCSMDIFRYSFIEGNHTAVFGYTLCVRAARHLIIFLYWRMARNYFEFFFLLGGGGGGGCISLMAELGPKEIG